MKRNLLFALFAVLAMTACSQDTVDSNQLNNTPSSTSDTSPTFGDSRSGTTGNIKRSYNLTYSEDGNMSFMATFRVKGTWNTTVKLDPPSRLTVDGREVSDKQLISKEGATMAGMLLPILAPFAWLASGTHYFVSLGMHSPYSPVSVVFTDPNGQDHSDSITIQSPGSYSVGYASRSGFTVSTMGSGSWTAYLRAQGPGGYQSAIASSSGGNLTFSEEDLSKFSSGSATLSVENSVDEGYITKTYKFRDTLVNL